LRRSTILASPAARSVSMQVFPQALSSTDQPTTCTILAHLAAEPGDQPAYQPGDLVDIPEALAHALRSDKVTLLTDRAQFADLPGLGATAHSLVAVPLNVGGLWIGQVLAAYRQAVELTPKETRPLMALASQAAIAVQNLRLLDETRRRASQLETAAEIARDTSGTLALDVLLSRAVNLIRDRYGYYHASIFLVDEANQYAAVREATGLAGEEMKRRGHRLAIGSRSIIGQVTATGQQLVINDVTQDETHRPNPLLPDTRAELAIPFKVGTRIIGALDVQSVKVGAFTPDDVNVLSVLADQLAVAVDNARSYELAQQAISETAQRVEELSTVYDVSQSIASASMQTQEIAQIICSRFIRLLPIDLARVYLIEVPELEEERRVRPANAPRLELPPQPEFLRMLAAQSPRGPLSLPDEGILLEEYPFMNIILQAGGSARPLILQAHQPSEDVRTFTTLLHGKKVDAQTYLDSLGLRSLLLVPLAIKGQVIGLVELRAAAFVVDPDPAQLNLLMAIANSAAVALENARLYEEQIATAEKMRELDQLKSAFLANMSHELRTPLNSIIGFSRVILKGIDGPISELQQQDLTAIHNAGTHLLNLINDVLDISKIEAGKMELAFDDGINISDLVNSAMSTAIGLTKDKPIRLERHIATDLPLVRADPTRIRQVLINFLSNAAKFTDEGVITVRAFNATSPDGIAEVMVSVTDSGPGISLENQAKLFQAFSQVDNSLTRKVGGTGLGLSISRLLIDLHGGRIGVESQEGKGATFYFALPVHLAPPSPAPEASLSADQLPLPQPASFTPGIYAGAPTPAANPQPAQTVLIIDDDRQVVNLYERYLQEQGYKVQSLSDPSQALETARALKPDIITLDIMMPKKDGWQVLETLKSDPETRSIPVVICSIVAEAEKAFSLGAVDYLAKPVTEEDLVAALQRLRGNGPPISDVLVIDDDPSTLSLVHKALNTDEIHVRLAQGGQAGLDALQQDTPDAIVLDLFMPGIDGFSLLESIRANPATQAIPVLVFTAGDLTPEQAARVEDFSSQLIYKNAFEEKEFLQSIEALLRRYQAPPE
jgi:signal transduction histidine kinase/DNA-binding response OmpR family regulator